MPKFRTIACLFAAAALLAGCQKDYTVYALTSTGSILKFQTSKPSNLTSSAQVTGLPSDDGLVSMAYLPSSGTAYCVTTNNELCTLDPDTGVASIVTSSFASGTSITLSGQIATSFDPVANELRLINASYNLLIPTAGTSATAATEVTFANNDTNSGKTPSLAAIAYNNQVSGATSDTLYALDVGTSSLVQVGNSGDSTTTSADNGILQTIGSLGVSFNSNAGFVIEQVHGTAYAALQQSGAGASLYTIDLSSGIASSVGAIDDGQQTVIALAMPPGQ
jgi:hypothetical protein